MNSPTETPRPPSGLTHSIGVLFDAWVSLLMLPFGLGASPADPQVQRKRADVRKMVNLYRSLVGDGTVRELAQIVGNMMPSPEQFARALVAWVEFLEALIQEAENAQAGNSGKSKLQQVKASVMYVIDRSKLDLKGVPKFLQPLLFDAAVDWTCDFVVTLLNRHQLWEKNPVQARRIGPFRLLLLWFDGRLSRVGKSLYNLAWWFTRSRHPLPPELRARLDTLVDSAPLDHASIVRNTLTLFKWMGQHRRQIVDVMEVVVKGVREAEGFAAMTGKQKKAYVRDSVLAFLTETGIIRLSTQTAYAIAAIVVDAGIDVVVGLLNRHRVFAHGGTPLFAARASQTPAQARPADTVPNAPLVNSRRIAMKEDKSNKRIGFIISGAGALIAQELALAKALMEGLNPSGSRIRPVLLSGASSGCLSSVLLSGIVQSAEQGGRFSWDVLEKEVLFPLKNSDIFRTGLFWALFNLKHALLNGYVLDNAPLEATLRKYISGTGYLNYHKLSDLYIPTYISAIARSNGVTHRFYSADPAHGPLNLVQVMMTSTAIPVAFPQRSIDTVPGKWVDGGVGTDTIPVAPFFNQEPLDEVYVITPIFKMPDTTDPVAKGITGIRALLQNMLFALEVQFNSQLNMQIYATRNVVKDPEKAFLYRPELSPGYGFLDFGVMRPQYEETLAWARTHDPIPVSKYLAESSLIPGRVNEVTARAAAQGFAR